MRRAVVLLLCLPLAAVADVTSQEDPDTGLLSWHVKDNGFDMQLLQVLPDYVRAVYESRGLPQAIIDSMDGYCVFGTILRNRSDAPIRYDVADWRYITPDGKSHGVKTKDEWVAQWRKLGVPFAWSILPTEQTFQPGDWGQGFTTVKLPHDSTFHLRYSWSQHGETHTGTIEDMRCAPAEPPARPEQ